MDQKKKKTYKKKKKKKNKKIEFNQNQKKDVIARMTARDVIAITDLPTVKGIFTTKKAMQLRQNIKAWALLSSST